jgi:hypothetical protein
MRTQLRQLHRRVSTYLLMGSFLVFLAFGPWNLARGQSACPPCPSIQTTTVVEAWGDCIGTATYSCPTSCSGFGGDRFYCKSVPYQSECEDEDDYYDCGSSENPNDTYYGYDGCDTYDG